MLSASSCSRPGVHAVAPAPPSRPALARLLRVLDAASFGLVIGLLGVLAGLVATVIGVAVAVLVQWNETQRAHTAERWAQATAKRERLRAEFERVLSGAYAFESLTSPFVWVNPNTLPAGPYRDHLIELVKTATEDLRLAYVRLRLEGATDVVTAINDLAMQFERFQRGLANKEPIKEIRENADAIKALVEPLHETLQHHLDALTPPDSLPERTGFRSWASDTWKWFRR